MARSLNKVELIGNLTRDPELRYTPQGSAVCNFGLATNRQWTTDTGEKKEDVEFHRLVAWNKLAEICAQLLSKGRKAYVEGRLQTREWEGRDGNKRQTTEIVISDMIVLDSKFSGGGEGSQDFDIPDEMEEDLSTGDDEDEDEKEKKKTSKKKKSKKKSGDKKKKKKDKGKKSKKNKGDEDDEDIPF